LSEEEVIFSQKGKPIEEEDVEVVECKDGKTRFRRKDNKTWVKAHGLWRCRFYVKFSYKSRRKWKNRRIDIEFEVLSRKRLNVREITEIAEEILRRKAEWFDFYSSVEIGDTEQEFVRFYDEPKLFDEIPDDTYEIEDERVYDLRGWD